MTRATVGKTITQYVRESVNIPDTWTSAEKLESDIFHKTYPRRNPQSGVHIINEWGHDETDAYVSLGFELHDEDAQFGIDVLSPNSALWHAHGVDGLDPAIEATEVAIYMMQHAITAGVFEEDESNRVDELEEAYEAEKNRAKTLESKNEILRNQINILTETMTTGYDEGNWHGYNTRDQIWRPPTNEEIKRLALHVDEYWHDHEPDDLSEVSLETRNVIEEIYMIVLDDYHSVVTGVEDKTLFVMNKTDGAYVCYLFNEDDVGLKTVAQRPEMYDDTRFGETVVSFENHD